MSLALRLPLSLSPCLLAYHSSLQPQAVQPGHENILSSVSKKTKAVRLKHVNGRVIVCSTPADLEDRLVQVDLGADNYC